MSTIEGLLISLLFLAVAAGALARIIGWRLLEEHATRVVVTLLVTLLGLPLAFHEATALRSAINLHAWGCAAPSVAVRPEQGIGVVLFVVGHLALGVWWLRRRARRDDRGRASADLDAQRRRTRSRLPPSGDDARRPT